MDKQTKWLKTLKAIKCILKVLNEELVVSTTLIMLVATFLIILKLAGLI